MKKLKKIKKKYYPNGGNLAGDLGTVGITNEQMNLNHQTVDPTLAGIAQGLMGAIGLGGITQAATDRMDTYGQLSNKKEYKTAAGISGGIAGLGLSAANMGASFAKMGNQGVENPPSYTEGDITGTGAIGGGSALDALNKPYINAHGGSIFPHTMKSVSNVSHLLPHHKQKENYTAIGSGQSFAPSRMAFGGWVPPATDEQGGTTIGGVYYGPQDLALLTQFEGSNTIDPNTGQPFRVFTDEQEFNTAYNPVRRMDNALLAAKAWETSLPVDKKDYFNPVVTNKGTLQGEEATKFKNTNQVQGMENTYSKKKKFKAMGGPMLTEFNNGGTHEQNPLGGIPVGPEAMVEQEETKFSSNNPDIGEFIFSEREKDPTTKKSYAKMSKIVKNKFKVRPDDVMAKEAMDQELNKLAMAQETQKADKAAKLMNKAMELSPELFQMAFGGSMYADGGTINPVSPYYTAANAIAKKKFQKELNKSTLVEQDSYNKPNLIANPQYPVDNKKKFPDGGKVIKPIEKNPGISASELNKIISNDYLQLYSNYNNQFNTVESNTFPAVDINGNIIAPSGYNQYGYKTGRAKDKIKFWDGGGIPTVNDLFVGPQLQNQQTQTRPYSVYNMPTEDQFATPDIYGNQTTLGSLGTGKRTPSTLITGSPMTYANIDNLQTSNLQSNKKLIPTTPTEEELNARVLSTTNMPQDLSGINAGMYGLQAAGEALRLGLTPDSRLTGNVQFDRVNPYSSIVRRKKAGQEGIASMREGLKNYLSPSQYIAAMTGSIGDVAQATGMDTAGIDLQGKSTNAQIQMREASANKALEAQRNEIIAQDISNRNNQLGAVGAGLTQNMNTVLKDKGARDMDMYSLQFMNKENYKLITTKEEADKYGVKVGDYAFIPAGFKAKTSKIKKKYNT